MPEILSAARALPMLVASALVISVPAAAQVAFPVSFDATAVGLTGPERALVTTHIQAAGQRWVAELDLVGARSIEVVIGINDAASTANGSSVTSSAVGVVGARNLFEQAAAAELRTGMDVNGVDPDIRITFNTNYLRNELWFDPDPVARTAPVPIDRTDAMSVALHEFGHALAYNGWADGQGQWPATYFSTFDQWMLAGTPTLFAGPAALLQYGTAPDLTTGNIHHWANATSLRGKARRVAGAVQWKYGAPVPLPGCDGVESVDAPRSVDAAHAKGNLPAVLMNELMNGVVFYRGSRYRISALDIATLDDAGLPVKSQIVFSNGFEGN